MNAQTRYEVTIFFPAVRRMSVGFAEELNKSNEKMVKLRRIMDGLNEKF